MGSCSEMVRKSLKTGETLPKNPAVPLFSFLLHHLTLCTIYYLTIMRTTCITLHTCTVDALENYIKSNNITKLLTEL